MTENAENNYNGVSFVLFCESTSVNEKRTVPGKETFLFKHLSTTFHGSNVSHSKQGDHFNP